MSRFANFIKGMTSPFTSDSGPPSERAKRARVRARRRERFNSGRHAEKAGDVDRRVMVNEDVRGAVSGNVRTKPYDPVFLRDISANAVVQAYIDTLSQDVSQTEWAIKPRDEEKQIRDDTLAQAERHLKGLPPGRDTFADVLESTTRVLLELGDGAIVKHYGEDKPDRLAEIVPVDSASLFKQVDEHGITGGFVQVSRQGGEKKETFDVSDVVWVEWSTRPDRFYGQGPLEKAQNEVELIEELAEKERLDLMQGGPPGVLSPEALDDYGGLPDDEDWEVFKERMRLDDGERHRVGYSKTPVQFEAINHNYQELQILSRSKYWVTVLGSVFKVNPSYAGFDFENVNRATDESQQAAYKQRGFRVTLRQLEEAINRALIWEDISPHLKFEFVEEQTVDEKQSRASLVESQASAGKEMANAGREVSYRDGRLVVEDGEIEEGDAGDGGGGGLFGSVDDPDDADVSIESRKAGDGDSGNGNDGDGDGEPLTKDQVAKLDEVLLRAHKRQIAPPSLDAIEKDAWTSDEDVPEFVVDKIRDVVSRGAVFDTFESVSGRVADVISDTLTDALTQPQGWSLDSIVDRMSDELPRADPDDLEVIARTESSKVLSEAREEGYRDRGLDDAKFKWVGPDDSRTTDACEELKKETNPDYGGTPVTLPKLIDKEREVQAKHFENLEFRKHTIHPNERHAFVRDSGSGVDDIDVDVPDASDIDVDTADFEPAEMSKAHGESYADVVDRVVKVTSPSRRMRHYEDALGDHIPTILRQCLEASDGSKEGALREFRRRLRERDDYDHDESGLPSKPTLYDWIDRYDTHVDHLR